MSLKSSVSLVTFGTWTSWGTLSIKQKTPIIDLTHIQYQMEGSLKIMLCSYVHVLWYWRKHPCSVQEEQFLIIIFFLTKLIFFIKQSIHAYAISYISCKQLSLIITCYILVHKVQLVMLELNFSSNDYPRKTAHTLIICVPGIFLWTAIDIKVILHYLFPNLKKIS